MRILRILAVVVAVLVVFVQPFSAHADEDKKLYNQAMAQAAQGKYEAAAESLRKAIAVRPKFAEAHHLLGIVYATGLRRLPDAAESFKTAIELNPNMAEAYYDLGLVYQGQGKFAEAEQEFQRALTMYPRYEESVLSLAQLY